MFLAHKALHPNIVQNDDGSTGAVPGQREGFVPAPRHQGRYANAPVPRRPNAGAPPVRKPALLQADRRRAAARTRDRDPDRDIRARLEMLLAVDEGLARIVATLKETGSLDRTVVIVTSDHGYFYGEHGLNEERRLAYEETARIPLIVRYPADRAGRLDARRDGADHRPRADRAGARRCAGRRLPREGRSLVPLLRGERPPWRTSLLIEYYSDTVFPRIRNMGYRAVRTERYKYIDYLELDGMDELYDLQADPYELDNLIDSDRGREMLPALRAELARLTAGAVRSTPE